MPRSFPPLVPDSVELITSPQVRLITYGDGYEQAGKDGINNLRRKWQITYDQQRGSDIDTILAFLNSTYGVEAFFYTPPSGAQALVRIDGDYNKSYQHQNAVTGFTVTLREVQS